MESRLIKYFPRREGISFHDSVVWAIDQMNDEIKQPYWGDDDSELNIKEVFTDD